MQTRTLVIFALGFLLGAMVTAGLGGVYFNTRLQLERARADAARAEAERERDLAVEERQRAEAVRNQVGGMFRATQDGLEEQMQKVGQAFRPPEQPKKQEP